MSSSSPFVKQLAASDRKTRDAALASLTKFLCASRQFEELELLKLWKGLYYCFWHSDRTPVQQALADDLSKLCLSVSSNNFIPFIKTFWITICREWKSIDILRLDKYYTLLRRFVGACFGRLYREKWDEQQTESYMQVLEELPLSADNQKIPNGIRYHLADLYIEELAKVVPEEQRSSVPINHLLRPFETIITQSPTKSLRLRVMKSVFDDKLLAEFGYEAGSSDEDSDVEIADVSDDDDEDEDEDEIEQQDKSSDEEDGESEEEFTGFD